MLNQLILFLLLTVPTYGIPRTKNEQIFKKQPVGQTAEHMVRLQTLAEQINRLNPLGDYVLLVPKFIIVSSADLRAFLAGIPYTEHEQKKTSKKTQTSMLEYMQQLWRDLHVSLKNGKLTAGSHQILEKLRQAIEGAFKHDLRYNPQLKIASFTQQAINNNVSLIVRDSLPIAPVIHAKSAYPVKAIELNHGIAQVLKSYYYAETIEQLLEREYLPQELYMALVIQSFVSSQDPQQPVISGMSCSYDSNTGAPGIVTIQSIQHHSKSLKDADIPCDTYYVHDGIIYPVIAHKPTCMMPDLEHGMVHKRSMNSTTQKCSSLDPEAIKQITHATQLVAAEYNEPVCISFIKSDHTIYLTQIHTMPNTDEQDYNYIDPLYARKALKDNALRVELLQPKRNLIVIKNPKQILFAPDLTTMLQLLAKPTDHEILAGFIAKMPSKWSKQMEQLERTQTPIIYVKDMQEIKNWLKEKQLPIVVDPQQKLVFPFKRRKGFCTLFQIVTHGLKEHPIEQHISLIDGFIPPLKDQERAFLEPKEFFSGVTLEQLFELIKHETDEITIKSLRSLLFRLQTQLKRAEITQKERAAQDEPFNMHYAETAARLYRYIERTAYQITLLLKQDMHDCQYKLQRLFLTNMLQNMVSQKPNDRIVHASSFYALEV